MLTYLGAASEFREKDVDEETVKNSKILHIEGFFVGNPGTEKAVIKAMKIAKANGRMISMDLADPGLIRAKIDSLKIMLKEYVDIVFVNEHEAKAFTGVEEEDAVHILSEYCDVSIVKLGSKGSIIKHHDRKNDTETVHKIPIHKVEVVNTNGAGDSYAAGILYSIANNIPMEKAGKIASYISSRVVSIPEATLSHSIENEVKRIVDE
jgi:sugar/nucleoside kinase (ribokinase family)